MPSQPNQKKSFTRGALRRISSLAIQSRLALDTPLDEIPTTKLCVVCEAEMPLKAETCPKCELPTEVRSREEMRFVWRCSDQPWMSAAVTERIASVTLSPLAYNAEQRRKMAKAGTAMKDGSFPIVSCGDAEKAIHAQGRATNQDAAVAHIKKRVRALGCTGSIFENYT